MPIIGIMSLSVWKRVALRTATVFLAIAIALLALEGAIRLKARAVGNRAAARFGGDRINGLTLLVGCTRCPLPERDMAVWALGELRDRRALPLLKARYSGAKCDHTAGLCQYELGKAIRKIGFRRAYLTVIDRIPKAVCAALRHRTAA